MKYGQTSEYLVYFVLTLWLQVFKSAASDGPMNVALNKPATQSTLEFFSFSFNWDASYAVDGDSSPVWPCSSTDGWLENNTNAWWKVDLEGDYRIEAVTIQNRGDCCGDRLRNLSIQIGKQQDTLHAVAFFEGPGTDGSYHVLPIPNLIGRYVKLEIANTMGAILTLCEVEVMGTEVRRGLMNAALNKPATQSTLEFFSDDFNWAASYAVDGDSRSNWPCSSTNAWLVNSTNAWWKVDLEREYRIEAVTIMNRADCCGERLRNLSIQIGRQEDKLNEVVFFEGPGTDGSYHVFPVANVIGRFVKLEIDNTMDAILTLCEVKVMVTEGQRGATFNKTEGYKGSATISDAFSAKNLRHCALMCLQQTGCTAANYNVQNSSCQLLSSQEPSITATEYRLIVIN